MAPLEGASGRSGFFHFVLSRGFLAGNTAAGRRPLVLDFAYPLDDLPRRSFEQATVANDSLERREPQGQSNYIITLVNINEPHHESSHNHILWRR